MNAIHEDNTLFNSTTPVITWPSVAQCMDNGHGTL